MLCSTLGKSVHESFVEMLSVEPSYGFDIVDVGGWKLGA